MVFYGVFQKTLSNIVEAWRKKPFHGYNFGATVAYSFCYYADHLKERNYRSFNSDVVSFEDIPLAVVLRISKWAVVHQEVEKDVREL